MLVVTTPTVEGAPVKQYIGMVSGEAISGVNMFKDFGATLSNMFGAAPPSTRKRSAAPPQPPSTKCAPAPRPWAPTRSSA